MQFAHAAHRGRMFVAAVDCWRLVPVYAALTGDTFAMTLFTRIIILAMAALSLNLIMGYGGMVSFGHAAYLGIGGYAVGILAKEGIGSGFVQWPVAIAASALYALVVGALSLRTRGVYFIMITLAFAQMIYYVAIGLDRYGGDDGLTIYQRSQFGGLIDLSNKTRVLLSLLCAAAGRHLSRCGASSIRASAWSSGARARTSGACAPSAFRLFATSSPVSSSPARCAASPARSLPITPITSARR